MLYRTTLDTGMSKIGLRDLIGLAAWMDVMGSKDSVPERLCALGE